MELIPSTGDDFAAGVLGAYRDSLRTMVRRVERGLDGMAGTGIYGRAAGRADRAFDREDASEFH